MNLFPKFGRDYEIVLRYPQTSGLQLKHSLFEVYKKDPCFRMPPTQPGFIHLGTYIKKGNYQFYNRRGSRVSYMRTSPRHVESLLN